MLSKQNLINVCTGQTEYNLNYGYEKLFYKNSKLNLKRRRINQFACFFRVIFLNTNHFSY